MRHPLFLFFHYDTVKTECLKTRKLKCLLHYLLINHFSHDISIVNEVSQFFLSNTFSQIMLNSLDATASVINLGLEQQKSGKWIIKRFYLGKLGP